MIDQVGNMGIKPDPSLFYDLDGVSYFSPLDQPRYTLSVSGPIAVKGKPEQPLVVLSISNTNSEQLTEEILKSCIDRYLSEDDVLSIAWFSTIIISFSKSELGIQISMDEGAISHLRAIGVKRIIHDGNFAAATAIPKQNIDFIQYNFSLNLNHVLKLGPYISQTLNGQIQLYPVYRLYPDIYHAFVAGIYPSNEGSGEYKTLNRTDDLGHNLIPVPSRLYPRGKGDLAYYRAAFKDVFDIKGLVTGGGSRVYAEWKDKSEQTSACIQMLADKGVTMIGRVKTTHPFSPRGDGYQSCGTSSSGPTSAIASYDWIDFAVGTDTGGSIRNPAAMAGLYSNKPTHGLLPLDGIVPAMKWTDAVGIITRSPEIFKEVITIWLPAAASPSLTGTGSLPSTIFVPFDDLAGMHEGVREIMNEFLESMKSVLGMSIVKKDISEIYPDKGEMMTVNEFNDLQYAWQWDVLGREMSSHYAAHNEGRLPPLGHFCRDNWQKARDQQWTKEMFNEAKLKMEKTGNWFNDLLSGKFTDGQNVIYVEPMILDSIPCYREQKLNDTREALAPSRKNPLRSTLPASYAGCPHYVVPIGQEPFQSLVSHGEEMQAIGMSLIASRRSDLILLEVIERLYKVGVLREVKTGLTAF